MRFKFPCPHCSATLNAQDEWRGRKATCKSCGKKLVVPLLEQPAIDAEQPAVSDPVEASTEPSAETPTERSTETPAERSTETPAESPAEEVVENLPSQSLASSTFDSNHEASSDAFQQTNFINNPTEPSVVESPSVLDDSVKEDRVQEETAHEDAVDENVVFKDAINEQLADDLSNAAPVEALRAETDEATPAVTESLSPTNFEIVEPTQPDAKLPSEDLVESGVSELAEITEEPIEEVAEAISEPATLEKTTSANDLFDFVSPLSSVGSSAADLEPTDAGSPHVELQKPVVSNSLAPTATPTASEEVDSEVILGSIRGSIEPVQTTLMYRLAVIPVAILMIILPLVYIALIAGVGYFTCWYAVKGLSVFEGVNPSGGGGRGRGMGAVLMYAAPLFASALTFIFLIKPLFARTKRSTAQVAIKPEQQRALFAFVEQIAKAVHAPKPTSIVIDTEVNASASFRRGWLSLFRRGDLELTIGLPLVERLTAQELAGVLAHEFGHFSQGLGMRLQYIVRTINMWFAQVVYQRDRADQWLANSARELDIRLAIVVYFTMFMIWLSRRVLWVLMMIGHGFSSILLRQMEYDADQHEIRLAGSDRFISTANKLPRLAVAYQEAALQMQQAFADERLVNHLPALVGINFDQQSAEILQKLDEHSATEKSSWFDTHPLNRDRIARAQQSASRGIMSLDIPASHLFHEYDALAKNVTRQFYVEIFEGEFKDSMLTEIDQVQALMESSKADYEARVKLLGEEFAVVRPIPLAPTENRREDFQQLLDRLEQIRKTMAENLGEFKNNCKSLEELERRWITAYQALSFQSCGITFKEKVWEGVPVDSAASTQRAADQTQVELGQLHERLAKFEKLLGARVDTTIQCLWSIKDCEQFSAIDVRERMFKALKTLASQFQCQRDYVSLKRDFSVVAGIFAAADFGNLSKAQLAEVEKHIDRLKSFASRICQSAQSTAYPFDHSRGEITLSQYLAPNGLKLVDMSSTCETSASILQNFDSAYIRSVGVLCEGVQRTEGYLNSAPRESLLQDAVAQMQRTESNSSIGPSNPPAIVDAAGVTADDKADVRRIGNC